MRAIGEAMAALAVKAAARRALKGRGMVVGEEVLLDGGWNDEWQSGS